MLEICSNHVVWASKYKKPAPYTSLLLLLVGIDSWNDVDLETLSTCFLGVARLRTRVACAARISQRAGSTRVMWRAADHDDKA
jgi:hypothetical protein